MGKSVIDTPWRFEKEVRSKDTWLADKIEAILKRISEWNLTEKQKATNNARKSLSELKLDMLAWELEEEDHKKIRKIFEDDSKVKEIFQKWMTDEEKNAVETQKVIAWAVWEDTAKSLQKVEWIWNRLSTWWDKVWEVFEQKWFLAWIWAVMLMFRWLFTWDFSNFDKFLNPERKEDVKESENNNSNKVDIKYQYASSAVSYIFWWESKNILNKLFSLDKFQNMTYDEVKNLYEKYKNRSKNWLEKELWINWENWDKLFKALWVLVDGNEKSWSLLVNFYSKKWENLWWKTIKECISWLYTNIRMFKSIENITTPDQIIDAWKNFALKIEQLPNWETEIKWEIYESLNELWISKNIILFINSRWKNWFRNIDEITENLDWVQSELNSQDKKLLKEKFIPFAKNIENTLWEHFWHKYKNEIKSLFSWNHLKPTELLELYAITWWSYNYDTLNDMQKTYIYTKLISLIDDRNPTLAWSFWSLLMKEWETTLPSWVLSMLFYLWWKLANWAEKLWKNLWWATKENPILAWMIFLTLYLGPWFSSKESAHNKIKRIFK